MKVPGWALPIVLAIVFAVGWTALWVRPQREQAAQLSAAVDELRAREAALSAEIARLGAMDRTVSLPLLQSAREQWKAAVAALEARRFTVSRVEIATAPLPAETASAAASAQPSPPQSPPPEDGATSPPPPPVEIVQVAVQVQAAGSYADLTAALDAVRAAVGASAWTELGIDGDGAGNVKLTAQLIILARR